MPPQTATKSRKKSPTKGRGTASTAKTTMATPVASSERMVSLESAAEKLPILIRPKYVEFDTPSGQHCIIKKLAIGLRDTIVDDSTDAEAETVNMALLCQHAIRHSLIEPKLTFAQVAEMDKDDFEVVWQQVRDLSYSKVGQAVNRFRN